MVLIGIAGGSGCGKSTVANLLRERIYNSTIINLDDYMRKYWEQYKEEIISRIDFNTENEHWHTELIKHKDNVKKWTSIIGKDIEKCIRIRISKINDKEKIVILDWAFLPLIPIYNECNVSILVKCDLETRLDRLTNKIKTKGSMSKWNQNTIINRLKNTYFEEFDQLSNYIISNNGTLEELEYNVDSVLEKITKFLEQ